jgi:uncharacterized integral membrane protein
VGKVVGFVACERGAITVDWVALVSGILVAGIIAVFAIYNGGVSNLVSNVNSVADGPTFNIAVGSVDGVAD